MKLFKVVVKTMFHFINQIIFYKCSTGCFHVPRCLHMCIKMLKELLEEETLTNGVCNGNWTYMYIP